MNGDPLARFILRWNSESVTCILILRFISRYSRTIIHSWKCIQFTNEKHLGHEFFLYKKVCLFPWKVRIYYMEKNFSFIFPFFTLGKWKGVATADYVFVRRFGWQWTTRVSVVEFLDRWWKHQPVFPARWRQYRSALLILELEHGNWCPGVWFRRDFSHRNGALCMFVWTLNRGVFRISWWKWQRGIVDVLLIVMDCKVCRNFFQVTPQLWSMIQVRGLLLLHFLFDNVFQVRAQVNSTLYKCNGFSWNLYGDFLLVDHLALDLFFNFFFY